MRKMFSKNQIGEIVNQGIQSGTIPAMSFPQLTNIHFEFNADDNYYILSFNINKKFTLAQCYFMLDNNFGARIFYDMEHEEFMSDSANYDYGEYEESGEDIHYTFYFNADEQASSDDKLEYINHILFYVGEIL